MICNSKMNLTSHHHSNPNLITLLFISSVMFLWTHLVIGMGSKEKLTSIYLNIVACLPIFGIVSIWTSSKETKPLSSQIGLDTKLWEKMGFYFQQLLCWLIVIFLLQFICSSFAIFLLMKTKASIYFFSSVFFGL